jgi:hypothetical protein
MCSMQVIVKVAHTSLEGKRAHELSWAGSRGAYYWQSPVTHRECSVMLSATKASGRPLVAIIVEHERSRRKEIESPDVVQTRARRAGACALGPGRTEVDG